MGLSTYQRLDALKSDGEADEANPDAARKLRFVRCTGNRTTRGENKGLIWFSWPWRCLNIVGCWSLELVHHKDEPDNQTQSKGCISTKHQSLFVHVFKGGEHGTTSLFSLVALYAERPSLCRVSRLTRPNALFQGKNTAVFNCNHSPSWRGEKAAWKRAPNHGQYRQHRLDHHRHVSWQCPPVLFSCRPLLCKLILYGYACSGTSIGRECTSCAFERVFISLRLSFIWGNHGLQHLGFPSGASSIAKQDCWPHKNKWPRKKWASEKYLLPTWFLHVSKLTIKTNNICSPHIVFSYFGPRRSRIK